MKRATVKVRTNPSRFGRAVAERIPYVEVEGWACEIAGEPCVVHRPISDKDGEPVAPDAGQLKSWARIWAVTHAASGGGILKGMRNETRDELVERAARRVEEIGGRETMLRAARELVEREGPLPA